LIMDFSRQRAWACRALLILGQWRSLPNGVV
jgi:hypothetical protein